MSVFKSRFLAGFSLVITSLTLAAPVGARYFIPQTKTVPVDRLIKNLQAGLKDPTVKDLDKSRLRFQMARLHAMAYALKTEEGKVATNMPVPDKLKKLGDLPYFGSEPETRQFVIVKPAPNAKAAAAAKQHLQLAIKWYREARKTMNNPAVLLGLAWCLEQNGQKQEAIKIYRDVWEYAGPIDNRQAGLGEYPVSLEAAMYLQKLLDPVKNKKELANMREKVAWLERKPRMVTPIVVPLKEGLPVSQVMSQRAVNFDVIGVGTRAYSPWPSPDAAWLVYDSNGSGKITSGLQLFGTATFWVFWADGYEALRSLDDNRDGVLRGAETRNLALWCDENQNGVSDPGEVQSLDAHGIESISCRAEAGPNGMLRSLQGIVFKSGRSVPTYDWILREQK